MLKRRSQSPNHNPKPSAEPPSKLVAQEPWELTFAKGELAACKRARTQVKQVIRNCIVAAKVWWARRNAHGNKPPRLKRCAWQKERARRLQECAGMKDVREEAESELQFIEHGVIAWERAVAKIRAALYELLLIEKRAHIPAWLV